MAQSDSEAGGSERRGITLYTDEGEPVEVSLMDERDNWITYDHCPETGFYAYVGGGKSLTMVLERSDDEPLTLADGLGLIQFVRRRIGRLLDTDN